MKKITFILGLLIASNSLAKGLDTPEQTKELCSLAAAQFGAGKIPESFNTLRDYWPLPEAELNNLSYQTTSQLEMVKGRFGNFLGSDFVRTKTAGLSFIQHTYVIKFQKHAARYMCVFYKPEKQWVINSIIWDDSTTLLFEQ